MGGAKQVGMDSTRGRKGFYIQTMDSKDLIHVELKQEVWQLKTPERPDAFLKPQSHRPDGRYLSLPERSKTKLKKCERVRCANEALKKGRLS